MKITEEKATPPKMIWLVDGIFDHMPFDKSEQRTNGYISVDWLKEHLKESCFCNEDMEIVVNVDELLKAIE